MNHGTIQRLKEITPSDAFIRGPGVRGRRRRKFKADFTQEAVEAAQNALHRSHFYQQRKHRAGRFKEDRNEAARPTLPTLDASNRGTKLHFVERTKEGDRFAVMFNGMPAGTATISARNQRIEVKSPYEHLPKLKQRITDDIRRLVEQD